LTAFHLHPFIAIILSTTHTTLPLHLTRSHSSVTPGVSANKMSASLSVRFPPSFLFIPIPAALPPPYPPHPTTPLVLCHFQHIQIFSFHLISTSFEPFFGQFGPHFSGPDQSALFPNDLVLFVSQREDNDNSG